MGVLLPVQASANALISRQYGHPVYAALWNFLSGTVLLAVLAATIRYAGWWRFSPQAVASAAPVSTPWWAWTSGVMGAFFVASSAYIAPRIGALLLTVIILAGQLIASAMADSFSLFNYPQRELTPMRGIGMALVVIGVALVVRGTR